MVTRAVDAPFTIDGNAPRRSAILTRAAKRGDSTFRSIRCESREENIALARAGNLLAGRTLFV